MKVENLVRQIAVAVNFQKYSYLMDRPSNMDYDAIKRYMAKAVRDQLFDGLADMATKEYLQEIDTKGSYAIYGNFYLLSHENYERLQRGIEVYLHDLSQLKLDNMVLEGQLEDSREELCSLRKSYDEAIERLEELQWRLNDLED